jgi:hypothetical protein
MSGTIVNDFSRAQASPGLGEAFCAAGAGTGEELALDDLKLSEFHRKEWEW